MASFTLIKESKSQIWAIDLIIALVIFMTTLIFAYNYLSNMESQKTGNLNTLLSQSQTIQEALLSNGVPDEWTQSNVKKIGISLENNLISEKKLQNFSEIAKADYTKTKSILGIKDDYYIYFQKDNTIYNITELVSGIGYPSVNSTNLKEVVNPKKIIKQERLVRANNQIVRMVVLVWE